MGGIHVTLELFIHAECCRTDCTFVGEMSGFQSHLMVPSDVIEELPLINATANRTPATVLAFISRLLHTRRYQSVRTQ